MYIVNSLRTDGFGAQYQTIIFTLLFSELEKLNFAYRPFTKMEHNYDLDSYFLEKKEELINVINHYPNYNTIPQSQIINFDLSLMYKKVESNLDYCLNTKTFLDLQKYFFENKTLKSSDKGKTVSLHIRRPNIFDIGDYGYTKDEYFYNAINEIRKKYSDISKIKIYSQGSEKDFEGYKDVELHLNESIEKTFTDLVLSDILIMSKGSFSYCAGLLCKGDVYYLPFWHNPKKTWLQF